MEDNNQFCLPQRALFSFYLRAACLTYPEYSGELYADGCLLQVTHLMKNLPSKFTNSRVMIRLALKRLTAGHPASQKLK